ncbi:MAG: hypothetical protein ACLQPD_02415 [Desulfomonilaceae bacterium]
MRILQSESNGFPTKGLRMIAGSIPQQSGMNNRSLLLCFFTCLFALVFVLSAWQPCESQSVPYRIDTPFYKKRIIPAPTFGIPQVLGGQQVVTPSGERVTVYESVPAAQTVSPQHVGPGWGPGARVRTKQMPSPTHKGPAW